MNQHLLRQLLFVSLFMCARECCLSQSKRGNMAVFGDTRALALNFNTIPPIVEILPDPYFTSFHTDEGSASISNIDGELLFYTNGAAVWNKEHAIMPHGNGLMGLDETNSTTQIQIIPFPKDPFLYYIISPQHQGGKLFYALVDIRLDGGRGDVILRDMVLDEATTEKACVIKHQSGEALWLVTHEFPTNRFKTFLIDEEGLHEEPVVSETGLIHSTALKTFEDGSVSAGANAIGYLKASPDGSLLACAIDGTMGSLELFSFNTSTGEISNPIELFDEPRLGSYGVEFSPDGTKLYLSCLESGKLIQFDVSSISRDEI